jgi:anthranilate phosphoribosyltransferase
VRTAAPEELRGGDRARNCAIAKSVLAGERGAARDIVLVNAAAGLVAAGQVATFLEGAAMAAVSIDSGAAMRKIEELARFSPAPSAV